MAAPDLGVHALESSAGAVERHAKELSRNGWEQQLVDAVNAVAKELRTMAAQCEQAYPEGSPS
jgi:hypothetical protein